MTDETRDGIRHHLAAIGRDILVLGALLSMLGGFIIAVSRPYWEPFAKMPENVALIQRQIVEMQTAIADAITPRIVEFDKALAINETVVRGETLRVLYFLKRNASCATDVEPIFLNVDLNIPYYATVFPAQRAPVTDEFIGFIVTVPIPDDIPPGRYVYMPRINPIECGVYQPLRVMPTTIFRVEAPK